MTIITSLNEARAFVAQFYNGFHGRMTALTGAGISTESGIPDFRSPGGIWSDRQPIQFQDFAAHESCRLEDWERRFEMLAVFKKATPNAAHRALAGLARSGRLDLLITQNVDGLHLVSGVPKERLVEIHGNSTYASCLSCGRVAALEAQREAVARAQSPKCIDCGGYLKAAVVSFGQNLDETQLQKAAEAAHGCDLFIVLGSSLVVQPAAQLPLIALQGGAELVIINGASTPLDSLASTVIRTPLAQTFAEVDEEFAHLS